MSDVVFYDHQANEDIKGLIDKDGRYVCRVKLSEVKVPLLGEKLHVLFSKVELSFNLLKDNESGDVSAYYSLDYYSGASKKYTDHKRYSLKGDTVSLTDFQSWFVRYRGGYGVGDEVNCIVSSFVNQTSPLLLGLKVAA